jgi:3-oxoacyl-[acyl-carrier-protein] synthase II
MATSSRRTVVTGIGIISPIGCDSPSYWDALCHARSGVRKIGAFDASGLPVQIAGEVVDFDAKNYMDKKDRKSLRVMARTIQLAVAASQCAMDDAQLDKEKIDPPRFGVEFGASLIATELEELGSAAQVSDSGQRGTVDMAKWGAQGLPTIPPLWMLKYLPNMLACHVSIFHNAQGPNNTVTESDVASLLALGEAYHILGRGGADLFLVGGGESRINPLSMVRQCLFQPLSHRNDAPEKACRPFDRDRDGMVLGEGAGVLVLEDFEHARRRQARIYAEMVGFGAAFDHDRSSAGLVRAIEAALHEAEIGPEDIDHVNAQGMSTVEADIWEAQALRTVFGDRPVPVFAPKSYMGNLGAGSGTTEAAASLLAMQHGRLPPTLNYETPDPACPLAMTATELRPVTKPHFLKIGFTDLGQCAAVVFRKS